MNSEWAPALRQKGSTVTIEQAGAEHRIQWLDYARFLCAMAVLLYHFAYRGPSFGMVDNVTNFQWLSEIARYGYLGVDFFFMVSGFVIMMSVEGRTASQFAAARFVRLYPAFFVCMTTTAVFLALVQDHRFPISFVMWLGNLPIIGTLAGVRPVDGAYWTLAIEIEFYVLVSVVLLAGLSSRIEQLVRGWLAVQVITSVIGANVPLVSDYFMLFSAGCLLFFATTRGWTPFRAAAVGVSIILNVADVARRGAGFAHELKFEPIPGVLMGAVLVFFLVFIVMGQVQMRLPLGKRIGSLTYPLYLSHQSIGLIVMGWMAAYIGQWGALVSVAAIMIIFSAVIAVFVEERPRRYWKALAAKAVSPLVWAERAFQRTFGSRALQQP